MSHSPPSFILSQHQDLALCFRWPKYQSFSISPSNEYSGLIFFKIDWFDLLAVHGTLRSLLQHHSLKASVLQCSASFMIHLSHPYMTTGEIIALTIWTFVSKMMSLLFNMLFRFAIAFLPRSKHLLISLILEPNFIDFGANHIDFGAQDKVCHCFHCFPVFHDAF